MTPLIGLVLYLAPLVFFFYLFLIIYFKKIDKRNWKVTENKQYEPRYQKYINNIKIIWALMVISPIIAFIVAQYVASKDTEGELGAVIGFIFLFFVGLATIYVLGFSAIALNIFVPVRKLKKSLDLYPSNRQIYLNTLARFSLPIKLHLVISSIIFFTILVEPLMIAPFFYGWNKTTVSSIEKMIDNETATTYKDYPTFKKDLTNYILNKDIRGISRMYSTTVSKKEVAKSISGFTLSTNQYTDFNNILSVNTVCSVDNKGNEYYGFLLMIHPLKQISFMTEIAKPIVLYPPILG